MGSIIRLSLATLTLLLASGGCDRTAPDASTAPRQIVLITVDTLRADRLGCYGHRGETSPHMDRFASGSVLFRQATVQAPWTTASFSSLFTGRFASEAMSPGNQVNPDLATLAELLIREGLLTAAVVGNPRLRIQDGYQRGFQRYQEVWDRKGASLPDRPDPARPRDGIRQMLSSSPKPEGALVTQAALELLPELRDRDFFLWVLYLDPHTPYLRLPEQYYRGQPPMAWDCPVGGTVPRPRYILDQTDPAAVPPRQVANYLYDGHVRSVDEQVGRLLEGLRESGILDRGLVVLTSDHGECLYDHHRFHGHGYYLYQSLVHAPLMIRWPGVWPGVVEEPVALVDLWPTLLHHAGAAVPSGTRGARLSPTGRLAHPPILTESQDWTRRALRSGPHKLIQWEDERDPEISLYQELEDPREHQDLAPENPELARRLEQKLLQTVNSLVPAPTEVEIQGMTPEERARIEALGYVD